MAGETAVVKPVMVRLRNTTLLTSKVEELVSRPVGMGGIGLFYGHSGIGKTMSTILARNIYQAYHLEVTPSWTKKFFYQKLLHSIGVPGAKGNTAELEDAAINAIGELDNPVLFLDDVQYMFGNIHQKTGSKKQPYHDAIRTLHNKAAATILLIGEEVLPDLLNINDDDGHNERIRTRLSVRQEAVFADLEDVRALAATRCPSTVFSDELLEEILKKSAGLPSFIVDNLYKTEQMARKAGKDSIGLDACDNHQFSTGKVEKRRRAA